MSMSIRSESTHSGNHTKSFSSYVASPNEIIRNVNRIALPAIALYALSNIPVVEAGPFAWAACIAVCEATAAAATAATVGAAAPSLIACVAACAPLLPLPFPP